ncbi:unnamed protein product, partial [Timema podura]|nr:unnamed protein product [Timema podura]
MGVGSRRVAEEGEQHDETHLRQGPKTTSVKSGPDSGIHHYTVDSRQLDSRPALVVEWSKAGKFLVLFDSTMLWDMGLCGLWAASFTRMITLAKDCNADDEEIGIQTPVRYTGGGDLSESSSVKSVDSQTSSPTPSHTSPVTSEGTQATATTAPRYFVIKAGSLKAIETSLNRGVWAFTPNTERKLIRLFKEGKRVVLVFSVQGSGHFQGFAHLSGDKAQPLDPTSDLTGPNLSAPLPVEWVKRANIPFQATRHLLNPYNENRRVQTSRDGQ